MTQKRIGAIAIAVCATFTLFAGTLGGAMAQKHKAKPPAKVKPAAKPKPAAASAAGGEKIYKAKGCAACHAIGAAGGKIGPDLSHVGKTMKPADIAAIIRDPKKKNPKTTMPAYPPSQVNEKDLKSLVAYLSGLK